MSNSPPLGNIGVWSMELRLSPSAQARDAAAELEELGFGTLWLPGLSGTGAVSRAGELLEATQHATIATGVLGLWSHDAAALAADHHRLSAGSGGRLLTGIGSSSPESATDAGRRFPGGVTAMRDYLDELDHAEPPLPVNQRIVAALGPKMTRLAADRALGAHPFLVTPGHIAASRALIGPGPLLAPHQTVVVESDPDRARTAARAGVGMFIGFPSYQANLRRAGFGDDDLIPGGSDRLIDALVAWGGLEAIERRISEHFDAGADHVALHVLTAQGGLPLTAAWREVAQLNQTRVTSTY